MIRALHRWPGLLAMLLVSALALSGAALSVFPAAERMSAPAAAPGLSVAALAARVQAAHPAVEQIRRAPSGRFTAYWFEGGTPGAAIIDPATGADLGAAGPNRAERWLTELHRSLFLGDGGRIATAAAAGAMLVLALTGAALVARRAGGWRRWFSPQRGPLAARLHVELGRLAILGLAFSSLTALWMTASTFGYLPDEAATPPQPPATSGLTGAALSRMPLLAATPASALRDLTFPAQGDAADLYTLTTATGTGLVDQGTGATLGWADNSGWQAVTETIYSLHTGRGAAVIGLVLGLAALSVPAMVVTGTVLWLAGRRGRPRLRGNAPAGKADIVILVGSEGGSTWGFAATLGSALGRFGPAVHVAPMAGFDPGRFPRAAGYIILAATYGEGAAPQSARGFLDRLAALAAAPRAPVAVLGFGDRSFPGYCAFAEDVARLAEARGWPAFLPFDRVDRQSPQDFARWGRALGAVMGIDLQLNHQPVPPAGIGLALLSRRDYGDKVGAPTTILRFALPPVTLWQRLAGRGFARFQAGDLLGILPEGSPVPRFYSLASGRRDGFIEIVVRKHEGGLCSGQLAALRPGQTVHAFLRRNPGFRAGRGSAPLILIGAGTGIGPLAGLLRANRRGRPVHLFFGLRHPDSDFLYGEELDGWRRDGRLDRLITAASRGERPHYVQDALRREAALVAGLVRGGARVMVCGGREMAAGVSAALGEILAPAGLSPALLKAEGRYAEDIY
ncbi:MAG: PepSY domain-containing protein [Proteobacteria bacterium]|nr:PepSY domain-containing protein [Pseudomonadota bacterium]